MSVLEKFNPSFVGVRNLDTIDDFKDTYYYRLANTTDTEIVLDVDDSIMPGSGTSAESTPHKRGGFKGFTLPPKSDQNSVKVFNGKILNAIGKDTILGKIYEGALSFQPLEIEIDTNYKLSNRTARRIGIENYEKKWGDLVIPPFGTRSVNSELLRWYKFLEWQRQDLIHVVREDQASKGPGSLSTLWDWVKLLPGVVLVAFIGFGIPLWIVYHFGGGNTLLQSFTAGEMFSSGQQNLPLMGLGRLFQVGFICIASILPALFYYLFGRQQVEKLRQKFFRDILVLDPHIYTLSEAESKYDTLLSSAYGSSSSGSPFTILLLMFSTALLVAGWTLTIVPFGPMPQNADGLVDFFLINPSPLTLGFLGTYFFSINMIFRRYVRADLTPKTYAYITVRLLITFVLVWSISVLPEFSSSSIVENGLLPLAFIIGVFPEDGFRVIRDSIRKLFGGRFGGTEEKYPLTDLDGMNQYDQARLLEEGIENIENLAHHNLIELLAFTRIPTARLVDMLDQAILYIHLGIFDQPHDQAAAGDQGQNQAESMNGNSDSGRKLLRELKSYGVRTATDLIETLKGDTILNTVVAAPTINHLQTIRKTFSDDEWLSYILNWRKECSKEAVIRASFINDPFNFYETGSPNGVK